MKRLKSLIIVIILILTLVFLNLLGVIGIFQKILSPIQGVTYSAGLKIKSFFQFKSTQELDQENQELKAGLKQALIDKTDLELLKQENEFFKKELDFIETSGFNFQVAKIIGKDIFQTKNVFIINKGTDAGIQTGLPVIISGQEKSKGYLVAKVVEVEAAISKIILITDPKSAVAAKVLGSQGTTGLVMGQRGLTLKMDLIPTDKDIKKHDLVVTSGLEEKIPSGLIIGQVEQVTSIPGDFFNQAKIKSFVDFDSLKIVTVLLP